jgi:hypothetical protein
MSKYKLTPKEAQDFFDWWYNEVHLKGCPSCHFSVAEMAWREAKRRFERSDNGKG